MGRRNSTKGPAAQRLHVVSDLLRLRGAHRLLPALALLPVPVFRRPKGQLVVQGFYRQMKNRSQVPYVYGGSDSQKTWTYYYDKEPEWYDTESKEARDVMRPLSYKTRVRCLHKFRWIKEQNQIDGHMKVFEDDSFDPDEYTLVHARAPTLGDRKAADGFLLESILAIERLNDVPRNEQTTPVNATLSRLAQLVITSPPSLYNGDLGISL